MTTQIVLACGTNMPYITRTRNYLFLHSSHHMAEICEAWCHKNTKPWTIKCTWPKSCSGCSVCAGTRYNTLMLLPQSLHRHCRCLPASPCSFCFYLSLFFFFVNYLPARLFSLLVIRWLPFVLLFCFLLFCPTGSGHVVCLHAFSNQTV